MSRFSSCSALALFLVLAPASVMAQDTTGGGSTQAQPQPETQQLPDATATQEIAVKPIDGQIVEQDKSTFLASEMIGSRVYSPQNEEVGDINDIIISPEGSVEGVVVGVGGFLGMGEKNVALAMNKFTSSQTSDKTPQLFLNATKEELEAAPSFKTAYQQQLEEESERQMTGEQGLSVPQGGTAPGTQEQPQQSQQ